MPFFNAPQTDEALTGDGDVHGYVTVASNVPYYPGALVWLHGTTTAPLQFIVVNLSSTTKVGLRAVLDPTSNSARAAGPQYGRSDVSAFTMSDGARISQEPSTVRVENADISKVGLIP